MSAGWGRASGAAALSSSHSRSTVSDHGPRSKYGLASSMLALIASDLCSHSLSNG